MTALKTLIGAVCLACLATVAQAEVRAVATMSQGSLYYSVGTAIAGVMQEVAHIPARVVPMTGVNSYIPLVNRGEYSFGMVNSADAAHAYQGRVTFAGHKNTNLRVVAVIFPIANGLAVPNDSPVKEISQLRGKRIPSSFPAMATALPNQNAILITGGLLTKDLKGFPVPNMFKGMRALGNGRVDVALSCFTCSLAKEVNVSLASKGGLRFLSMPDTPKTRAAMKKIFPTGYMKTFKPNPAFVGIRAPTTLFVHDAFLVANKNVPDSVVYDVVKALYHNKPKLVETTGILKGFNPHFMSEQSVVPYHPGAIKFYKQIGEWPPGTR